MLTSVDASERWTRLVDAAHWTLFLARETVEDQPLPWQKPQRRNTKCESSMCIFASSVDVGATRAVSSSRCGGKINGWADQVDR